MKAPPFSCIRAETVEDVIECAHVVSMTNSSELGAKGAGEAGTAGAPAAVMNALNDALSPFGAKLATLPFTPQRVLEALGTG